jgi:hypothetical protein
VLFKMAVLRDAGVAYLPLGLAGAKVLILGKFVLIGDAVHLGPRVGARTVLMVTLVPLVVVMEVSRAMGPGALRDLISAPPGPASAVDVPAKSRGSGAS